MKRLMPAKISVWCMVIVFIFVSLLSSGALKVLANDSVLLSGQQDSSLLVTADENIELFAGSTNTIKLTLKNVTNSTTVRNIVFPSQYLENSAFVSIKPITEMPIKSLNSGGSSNSSVEMELEVEVDRFAESGTQALTFKLLHTDTTVEYNPSYGINIIETKETTTHTVYVKVINLKNNGRLTIETPEGISATAGSAFDLPLTVKNIGDFAAKDVKINISGLAQDGFTLISGTGGNDLGQIAGGRSQTLTYSLRASSSLKSGSYPVNFTLEYMDEKGRPAESSPQEIEVWIPVAGSGSVGSIIEVTDLKAGKATVKPGETFDVVMNIKNSGEFDTGQIKIFANVTEALLPVTQNMQIIQGLKKGESKSITFSFQPQPQAERGSVPITIKVEPVNDQDGVSISQAISVFIDSDSSGTPEPGKNIPKIIIKSYSSEPTLVNAGETFNLTMQFLNTHSSREVRNIKGSFSVSDSSSETGNVFTPVGSSNTFYIDKINPQSTADWDVTLYTIPDAKSKTYTMSISFEYEDDLGTQHSATEIIGIPVYQPSRFEVSDFIVPSEASLGVPIYLFFEMYNLGKTDIYNVKLNVEGDFEAQPSSNYFGNFESGRVEYFELNIVPTMPGEAKGRIVFQYENASGEVQETVKDISMNVIEEYYPPEGEFPVDGFPMDPGLEEPNQSFFSSVWFYIIIGVVVVAGVVTAIILIKRKKKKKEEFEF